MIECTSVRGCQVKILDPKPTMKVHLTRFIWAVSANCRESSELWLYIWLKFTLISRVHAIEICLFLRRLTANFSHNSNYYAVRSIWTDWLQDGRSGIESRWGRDFPLVQTGPGALPAFCKMGTGSFPGVKCGRGVLLTTHPLLVLRSWKSRSIPLPTL